MNRREIELLEPDRLFLDGLGLHWEVINDGSIWVLIHDFLLPVGYTEEKVILAIRIETGYPMTGLDMMYVHPWIKRKDDKPMVAVDVPQNIDQKQFQRWSRHRSTPWMAGQDSLETHYYLVEDAFKSELAK